MREGWRSRSRSRGRGLRSRERGPRSQPRGRNFAITQKAGSWRRTRSRSRFGRPSYSRSRVFWRSRSRVRTLRHPRSRSRARRLRSLVKFPREIARERWPDFAGCREGVPARKRNRFPEKFQSRYDGLRSNLRERSLSSRTFAPRQSRRGNRDLTRVRLRRWFQEVREPCPRENRWQDPPEVRRRAQKEAQIPGKAQIRRGDGDLGRWQWRQRRSARDGAESRRPAQRPAAQTQSHVSLRQKQSTQQSRPAATDRNRSTAVTDSVAKLPTQSPPIVAGPSSKQTSLRGVKTYAEMVRQRPEGREELREIRSRQSEQALKRQIYPVDPAREGRCFRCLERGHAARECRDPITCRLCRQPGHRQASCHLRRVQRANNPGLGMFDCLVGDVLGEDPSWEHILDAIRTVCPDLVCPDVHRLVSGTVFIRKVAKADWRKLLGDTQQLPGGASITWRRPRPSDGAFVSTGVTKTLEIRGVPFGFRTWPHLERVIQPVGTLRKIVCEGIQAGDPNCVCLDVDVDGDKEVPSMISTVVEEGRVAKIMVAVLPPPPPLPQCHHPVEQQQEERMPVDTGSSGGQARPSTPRLLLSPPLRADHEEKSPATQAIGSHDSTVLCYSRRRQDRSLGTPRGGNCWFSQLVERQWVTLRTPEQATMTPLDELESPKTTSSIPQAHEEQRTEKFIPDGVVLLPNAEVGQEMGAERGDDPVTQ